jgi:flagellar basal-body rod protein FlgB
MTNKIAGFVFDRAGLGRFEKFLDLASFEHKHLSANLANAATPGYRSRSIDFFAEFRRMTGTGPKLPLMATHKAHISSLASEAHPEVASTAPQEGELNSVDVDREISSMAQNELLYTTAARLLKMRLDGLRKAITSKE